MICDCPAKCERRRPGSTIRASRLPNGVTRLVRSSDSELGRDMPVTPCALARVRRRAVRVHGVGPLGTYRTASPLTASGPPRTDGRRPGAPKSEGRGFDSEQGGGRSRSGPPQRAPPPFLDAFVRAGGGAVGATPTAEPSLARAEPLAEVTERPCHGGLPSVDAGDGAAVGGRLRVPPHPTPRL